MPSDTASSRTPTSRFRVLYPPPPTEAILTMENDSNFVGYFTEVTRSRQACIGGSWYHPRSRAQRNTLPTLDSHLTHSGLT
jgi:hypothetical protein